jgi:hypothetical protein
MFFLLLPSPIRSPKGLTLTPKIHRSDKAITARRVGITATRRGDMAADVVHALRYWYVLPQVLESHTLHLFVNLNSLREF